MKAEKLIKILIKKKKMQRIKTVMYTTHKKMKRYLLLKKL